MDTNTNVYKEIQEAMATVARLTSLKGYIKDELVHAQNRICNSDTTAEAVNGARELVQINKVNDLITAVTGESFREIPDKDDMEWLMRIIR